MEEEGREKEEKKEKEKRRGVKNEKKRKELTICTSISKILPTLKIWI